ncbi:hypothetical protein J3R30DRAFT_3506228 [Lentinula aciculospora]|uniref:Uncharacterized protein n=1 Tax=Lentinula aciculospora TaxID=153920 RepID=A0A9W9DLS4_9AGAR|nr:hypothetical protein J3R30DRAFT_3506228 [Lentinula aciculospora]
MQNIASSSASSISSISSISLTELPPSTAHKSNNASAPVEILKRPAAARKKKLEDDPWTADVSTVSVTCLGCRHLVRLSTKSLYDNHHWLMHKQRCKRAGNMKDNLDIGQPSLHPPDLVQTNSKVKSRLNRKAKRAPSTSSSVSSLTPISTPPLTSDEEDEVDGSSVEELELPPRPIPVRTSGKRDVLTEQYFARAHGIRIRLPPVFSDTQNDWRDWKWSELRMPEFSTDATPSPHCSSGSSESAVDSDVVSVKSELMAKVEDFGKHRSRSTRAQLHVREDPTWSSSSYHA